TTNKPNENSTVESNQENVILKIVAADENGNPIKDANGEYLTQNEVPEGNNAYYVVLAFEPNTTKFNDTTKLDVQSGTVEVQTVDKNATGITTQTKEDGTQDYISKTEKVELGKVISVKTLDDWKADNGEQYEIKITDKSYEHPTTGAVYENVVTDKNPVTTTIKDNTTDKPNDPSTTETNGMEKVILKIVAVGEDGNPIIKDGKYTFANEVAEGSNAKYMVIAFKPDTTEFKVTDKLDIQSGTVTIKTTDDTAKTTGTKDNAELDYVSETAKVVTVGEVFEIKTLDDYLKDDGEKYKVSINDKTYKHPASGAIYENVVTDKDPVTTTIKDNTTPGTEVDSEDVKIVLVATDLVGKIPLKADGTVDLEANKNLTPEGGKLYYIAVAVDKDGKPLATQGGDVTIKYGTTSSTSDKDATAGTDYDNTAKVNTKVGVVFEVKTKDDYYAEGDEKFTVKITDLKNSPYETSTIDTTKDTVTSTISDNTPVKNHQVDGTGGIDGTVYGKEDTVYAVITADKSSVVEGNKVTYTVKLVAGDGTTPVKVSSDTNVTIKFEGVGTNVASLDDLLKFFGSNGTTEIIGFDNTNQELTISIPKGSSSTQFTIQTKDDFIQEGNEKFDLSISEIDSTEFENLVFDKTKAGADNKVTTEIKDGITLGTPKNAYVDEDNFYKNDFNNTDSSSEYTTKSISNLDNKIGHIKGDLGIIAPIEDNGYTLSFDNNIKVYKGNENATETNIYGDGTALKSGGQVIEYVVNGDTITGYAGTGRGNGDKVFEIKLNKNAAGGSDDNYKYTQYKNIDHPVAGDATDPINDDNITFEFGFKISDQGSTSDVQKFKVTVNDSTPIAGENTLTIYEDNNGQTSGAYTFVLSDEGFKNNTIEISNDDGKTYQTLTTVDGANSIDILENGQKIGTLTNKGDGKLEFKPVDDYSKYTDDNLPNFKYKVYDTDGDYAEGKIEIKVKPVADAPTVNVKDVTTYEDASKYDDKDTGNKAEGQNKIPLSLIVPSLSKDQTDKNNATGDAPERNGEITLSFANGLNVKGVALYNGDTKVADISANDQVVKIVIVKTSGGTDIDTDYHHSGTLPAKGGNVLYLTKAEYEGLKIQHAEDNDTDIAIKISVTSYEVDDSGKPLTGNLATSSTTTADMTVIIKPVTDDIELTFDNATVNGETLGTISPDGKTFVFKNDVIKENGEINFKQLLTNTSGTTDGTNGAEKGDLDGSEIRWYTVKFEGDSKEHPDYLIINGKTVSLSNGEYKYEFTASENTKADPDFKVQFPNGYSGGTLKGELTLHVQDRGVEEKNDSSKWGEELKQTVKFEVAVNPVADEATLKVGQVVGYEDTARNTNKNIQDKDGTIKHPENGIALDIKVSSTDTDGSETFTVTIKDIPDGGAIFVKEPLTGKDILVTYAEDGTPTIKVWNNGILEDYTGTTITANKGSITIEKFDNENPPKFIPPHNEHGDFKLNVDAKTVDTVIIDGQPVTNVQDVATNKDILVVVKDVADSVIGNDYNVENLSLADGTNKDYNLVTQEDTQIKLDSVFKDSTKLSSYDKESEDLTIILKSLPKGVELEGNVTLINGQYIFKASDISSIKIVTPSNYSGELNFDITYITTEKGEANNPSKTHDSKQETDKISIFVKPTIDAQFDSQTTKAEDSEIVDGGNSYYKVDLGISHQNGDNDETLESVTIKAPEANSGYKLFIIDGNTKTEITSDYTLKTSELNKVYVEVKENQHGSFDIKGTYTVKDSQYVGKDVNYETKETKDFTHKLTITPVTDTPTIEVETGTQTHINVNAGENTEIKIPVKVSSEDTDGSENITKIVISGVPKGVIIDTGSAELDAKITVSEHNGIYTITGHNLNSSNFKDIVFKVDGNANFEYRDITITAYTKDAQGSIEEQTSTKITLDKTHNGNGGGTGTGPKLDIIVDEVKKDFNATEDTEFNFLDVFKVTVADNSNDGRTELNFKIDVGSNATLKGLDAYKNADGSYTIKGNRADIESVLANLKVVPNKDFNSNQDADGISIKVETNGNESTIKVPVTPVTDSLNVEITANDSTTIDENGEFNFDIKLTNNSDKEFTNINDFYVVVNENFEAGESSKGKLYLGNDELELVDGKYKLPADYKLGDSLNLTYKSGEDRHGAVEIKVIALNKETHAANELTSTGTTTITVKPVASSEIEVKKVQDGIEDKEMASAKLNVVKADPSEKFESVLIKVASGVAIYYNEGKSLAMNLGDGSWLVPVNSDGTLPQIFFKGNEHFGGEIKFDAIINVKDGNSKSTIELKDSSVYIKEVADGVTIDPTKTGIDAKGFEWTSLNLNANMKDVDGSEKMHFTLEGLDSSAQFRIVDKDGNITDLSSQSKFENGKWTINGIEYEDINNIQITHDKSVKDIKVEAWTQDGEDADISNKVEGKFDLNFTQDAVKDGTLTLGKEMNIDFSKIESGDIKDVSTIDLGAQGENKLLNLTLQDVMDIGKKDGSGNINLTILGDEKDGVSFAKNDGWKKSETTITENNKTFDVYTNDGNLTVQVKVEQPISDGITN
ncbi:hypothetical protein, partial [Aliarcobacter butzleri]|uniref:hypothetical protein n=1 Tax=Aliarcobacter butzleri TaxID=28197 RepID=UPI00344D876E